MKLSKKRSEGMEVVDGDESRKKKVISFIKANKKMIINNNRGKNVILYILNNSILTVLAKRTDHAKK